MSNFLCEFCGAAIIDSGHGYITECEHYPNSDGAIYAAVSRRANPGAHAVLDRVIELCVEDILAMSDDEVMAEAAEKYGSKESALAEAQRIRGKVIPDNP